MIRAFIRRILLSLGFAGPPGREGYRLVYPGVSRDGMEFHLSSHHDDGTSGTAALVVVRNLDALHAQLHKPSFNPSIRALATKAGLNRAAGPGLTSTVGRSMFCFGDLAQRSLRSRPAAIGK